MEIISQFKITFIEILFMSSHLLSQERTKPYADFIFIEKLPRSHEIITFRMKSRSQTRYSVLDQTKFLILLLDKAKGIRPDDEKLMNWHYSSWYDIEFTTSYGNYKLELYLGGLGFMTLPNGKTGAVLFDLKGLDGLRVLSP
ncbi:hypothetical protein [Leptospira mayottensis]|uniref:hypothetical protein n=1 Tax=Leptospira mayottensis TaxID=1137606 RepID=UPI000E3608A5|nr:hypothetical protein [Leptospira mayottensis]AXR69693.1 hypothetical protein DPV73_04180 [Leptospira mayottensis]